jgi:anti-sigma regulatory factor (Ser/Thr protein kinase)
VTSAVTRALDFAAVDDLAFAAESQCLDINALPYTFECNRLGPLLELHQLTQTGGGPPSMRGSWLDAGAFDGLGRAMISQSPRWTTVDQRLGLLKTTPDIPETEWIAFGVAAQRAAAQSGLLADWAAQMVAALGEFRSNIIEHSAAAATGLVAYRSQPGLFEFVASDQGVGLLSTLREAPEYQSLTDHCEALRLTLTEGASRHGFDQGRGYGFRPLFTGLANRQAALRFRTGTGSLTIDGTTPSLARAQLGHKAKIGGFFISVTCLTGQAT